MNLGQALGTYAPASSCPWCSLKAVAHHVLLLPTHRRNFSSSKRPLGLGASWSSHIVLSAGKGSPSFPDRPTALSASAHTSLPGKSSPMSPPAVRELVIIPPPHVLPSDEGQACVSPSWSVPKSPSSVSRRVPGVPGGWWQVLVLLPSVSQPGTSLRHTVTAQQTSAG